MITIAHPEHSSGELINDLKGMAKFGLQGMAGRIYVEDH